MKKQNFGKRGNFEEEALAVASDLNAAGFDCAFYAYAVISYHAYRSSNQHSVDRSTGNGIGDSVGFLYVASMYHTYGISEAAREGIVGTSM